jgi:hypothetical protein
MTARPAAARFSFTFLYQEFATFRANLDENVTMKYASESILWWDVFLFATRVVKKSEKRATADTQMAPKVLLMDYPTAVRC